MNASHPSYPDAAALADLPPVPAEQDMPADRQQILRDHLMAEFRQSAASATRTRPKQGSARPVIRLSRRVLVAGVAAAAVSVTVAVTMINVFATGPPAEKPGGGCVVTRIGGAPINGAYRTTLARAESAVGFPIPLPHSALAARRALSAVWVNPAARLAALVYRKGKITILLQPWPTTRNPILRNPERWFRYERSIMVKNSAVTGRVNGEPALIIRPHTGYCPTNPALVVFYRRGLEIVVLSPSYDDAVVLNIAQTVR